MDFATTTASSHPTPAQLEVLRLKAQGQTYEEIGAALFISRSTVRNHLVDARNILDALDTTHAVVICIAMGLIDPHASEPVGLELAAA